MVQPDGVAVRLRPIEVGAAALVSQRSVAGLSAVVAAVLAWSTTGRSAVSIDEAYTMAEARLSWGDLWGVLWHRELNASLHTLVTWSMSRVPGLDSVTTLRALSTAFGVLAVFVTVAVLGRLWAGAWPLLGLLLFANPLVLDEMVSGRTYTLTLMLAAVSLLLLVRARDDPSWTRVLIWGGLNGIMLYAHFFAAALVVAQVVWLALGSERRVWRRWAAGAAVTALLAAPIGVFLAGSGARQSQLPALPALSAHDYVSGVFALIIGASGRGQRVLQVALALLAAVLVVSAVRATGRRREVWLGGAAFILPIGLGCLASLGTPSAFTPRYMMFGLPGLMLFVCGAVVALGRVRRPVVAALVVTCVAATGLAVIGGSRNDTVARDPWGPVAQQIAAEGGPAPAVTTVAPMEGFVARTSMERAGFSFGPAFPGSAAEFLRQSTYPDRACLPVGVRTERTSSVWVLSTMSPDFDAAVDRIAGCSAMRVVTTGAVGYVSYAELRVAGTS